MFELTGVYLFWMTRGDLSMADEIQDTCSQCPGFYFVPIVTSKGPRPSVHDLAQKHIVSRNGRGK